MGQLDAVGHHGKVRQAAQLERNSARSWTAVKGPFCAAVATMKRMQRWCMHDGRIVDPRRVCSHSTHTLLKKAARVWQWRRVALHAGCEGLDRGAVVAPLFAALCSPRLSTQEQAYSRSVVVDGQWTQRHKYRAAKTLSPTCALCSSEEGTLIHRHFRCSEVPDGETSNTFHAAARPGALWEHESFFAARALLPELKGRPPGYTVRPKVKTQTCAWQAGVWWRTWALGSPLRSPERCRS